jgi:hypothetical protein
MLGLRNHWTSYYKCLRKGHWSWLGLARQFTRLIVSCLYEGVIHLAIDNILTLRASSKVPCSQIRKGLVYILRHVWVRDWWNPTCKKIRTAR